MCMYKYIYLHVYICMYIYSDEGAKKKENNSRWREAAPEDICAGGGWRRWAVAGWAAPRALRALASLDSLLSRLSHLTHRTSGLHQISQENYWEPSWLIKPGIAGMFSELIWSNPDVISHFRQVFGSLFLTFCPVESLFVLYLIWLLFEALKSLTGSCRMVCVA